MLQVVAVCSLIIAAACGCGRRDFDEVRDGGTSTGDVVVGPGSITGRVVIQPWGVVDLTAMGPVDWNQWGWIGIGPGNRHQKAGVTSRIADWARLGMGGSVIASGSIAPVGFTWTDGMPTATASLADILLYVDTADVSGDGFELRVAAEQTMRTFTVYTGQWCILMRVTASLDDGSATPFVDTSWDIPTPYGQRGRVEIDFAAGSPGATLVVALTVEQNHCTTGDFGEVWLAAATLQ